MTHGIKDAVGGALGSLQNADNKAEKKGSQLLDRLGDKYLGKTAESETNNAETIAPDATVVPSTQGRRSRHPEGHDPYHAEVAEPAPELAPAPADES